MLHRKLHRSHQAVASEARTALLRLCSSCAQDRLVRRSSVNERQQVYILRNL